MGSKPEREKTSERRCLVTKQALSKDELFRFVASPDNTVVFDLTCKLPGKGMWVKAERKVLETAFAKNVFAVVDRKLKLDGLNLETIENQLKRHIHGLLSLANKAGLICLGQERIAQALDKDEIFAVIVAKDGSQNSKNRLQSHIKKNVPVVDFLETEDLEQVFPGDKVAFVGLKHGKITDTFLREVSVYDRIVKEE